MFRFHVSRKLRMHADPLLQQLLYQLKRAPECAFPDEASVSDLLPHCFRQRAQQRPRELAPHITHTATGHTALGQAHRACHPGSWPVHIAPAVVHTARSSAHVMIFSSSRSLSQPSHYRTRASTPISMNRARVTVSVLVRPSSVLPRPVRWSTQPCPPYVPPRPVRWSTQPVRPAHA